VGSTERRVAIIGGGPGGLFLATLLKQQAPDDRIIVFEQNPEGATYGFGVGFTDPTLDYFRRVAPRFERELREHSVRWEHIEIRHRDRTFRCERNEFTAIRRSLLLHLLQRRAEEVDVEIHFEHRIDDLDVFAGYDLIVGADGVNSVVRASDPEAFVADVRQGRSKYIWFGSDAPDGELFDALTFSFVENDHGPFGIHAYPYGSGLTESETAFIVETDEDTWRRAGLDRHEHDPLPPGGSDLTSKAYCEELFADDLGGWPLITNNSKWVNFPIIRCGRWHAGNRVLIGDAVHTAHFSLGSGTKLAMEDSIALSEVLRHTGRDGLDEALSAYQANRHPSVARLQRASEPSRQWWEHFKYVMHLPPPEFAFNFMTRSGLMTWERLRQRDHHFTDEVLQNFLGRPRKVDVSTSPPLSAPYGNAGLSTVNRVVGDARASSGTVSAEELGRSFAICGAGMVVLPSAGDDGSADYIRRGTETKVAVELAPVLTAGSGDDEIAALRQATAEVASGSWDALIITLEVGAADPDGSAEPDEITAWATGVVTAVGEEIDGRCAQIAVLSFPGPEHHRLGLEEVAQLARSLVEAGASMVGVRAEGERAPLPHLSRTAALLVMTDAIRNRAGVPTLMLGGVRTDDDVNTLVLSRRADLVGGSPRLAGLGWDDDVEAT
jgi:2-polyprenyl-6-methoxyphenol hydroxylase-like FAD-dependent oxidoreductase